MVIVHGLEYTREDFCRRFRDTYVEMVDGTIMQPRDTFDGIVMANVLTFNQYGDTTTEARTIPIPDFQIKRFIPEAGYFNVAADNHLVGFYLQMKTHRQTTAGLSSNRVNCLVSGINLARAYKGFYASLAEAAHTSHHNNSLVAVSRSFALKNKHILFRGVKVGRYDANRILFDPDTQEEVVERFEMEGVAKW